MLLIHKSQSRKKLFFLVITSICSIGVLLGLYGLTYTSELSHAETVIYPEKETRDMSQITYMQEITPEICQNSTLNQQYTLTDSRDENTYTVARIKNQTNDETNCWMTQNLRIINKTISHLDSDMASGSFTIPTSSISGYNSSDQYKPKAYYYGTSYGGYYNWYTATAGSGDTSVSADGASVSSSICPKGWKLPTSGSGSQFDNLFGDLLGYVILGSPYNFQKSGILNTAIDSSAPQHIDKSGYYWSSTVNSGDSAYYMSFATYITVTVYGNRYYGVPVRCLALGEEPNYDNIEITINNTISLDVASEIIVEKSENNPSTANLDVKVASNQPYNVGISSSDPVFRSNTASTIIPSKPGLLNTNENAWGIKLSSSSTYSQITSTPTTFYTATGAEVKTIPFTIGISTAPDLPNGEYSTNITITATQN